MNRQTLFISDLHLDASRPTITDLFLQFLSGEARQADALYILGDLFEAWIGDDAPSAEDERVIAALRSLSDSGVPVYFMHGNRDFLIGPGFATQAGCTLLDDPTVIDLYGMPTLLMHGDTLCTDDLDYQQFRRLVRDPVWQQDFLAKPIAARRQMARAARDASRTASAGKTYDIMDANSNAVLDALRQHGVTRLIHGHTHRPAVHDVSVNGKAAQRIVLGDWYEQGSVLRCTEARCELHHL